MRRTVGRKRTVTLVEILILVAIAGIIAAIVLGRRPDPTTDPATPALHDAGRTTPPRPDDDEPKVRELATRLATGRTWKEGLAAVVLVDVSGSMRDRVRDASGERRRKLEIAQRAAVGLVDAFERYAKAHADQPVMVGVFEFSQRGSEPPARVVVAPGRADAEAARQRIYAMEARGGTPIGDAMIEARRALDGTGLSRRHLIVLTDGENTDGVDPTLVARALERQTDAQRAALYFIAFDVDAGAFAGIRDAGALLLPARDGGELAATFDELLSDRILVEAPRAPVEAPRTP
jgi:Mg-chelatase subunit ChlD